MSAVLRISLPLTLWLASFSAVYGLHGLICSSRWAPLVEDWMGRVVLIGAAIVAIAVQGALFLALRSPKWATPDRTIQRTSLTLAIAALVASVWTLFPTAVTSCL